MRVQWLHNVQYVIVISSSVQNSPDYVFVDVLSKQGRTGQLWLQALVYVKDMSKDDFKVIKYLSKMTPPWTVADFVPVVDNNAKLTPMIII